MPELLGLLFLNMIIFFQEDFQEMSLEKRMKFIETIIQNASLEELDEIKKIIYKIQ